MFAFVCGIVYSLYIRNRGFSVFSGGCKMNRSRILTLSRRYYKKKQYKITYYDVYGHSFCKIMEKKTDSGWTIIGSVKYS